MQFFGEEHEGHAGGKTELQAVLKEVFPQVSLRLGHAAALDATGIHSLPRRRFATPFQELSKHIIVI